MGKGKTIAVDFDGVLHTYDSYGDGSIIGEPIKDGAMILKRLREQGYRIVIFTTRLNPVWSDADENRENILKWFKKNGFEEGVHFDELTNNKPEAIAYIDDRAIRFTNWIDMKRYFI